MLYLCKLTRSQHMALVCLLGERLKDNPSFADCTSAATVITTVEELFSSVMQLDPSRTGYTITTDEHSTRITCHTCGLTSWNANDVEQLYCGKCQRFHGPLTLDRLRVSPRHLTLKARVIASIRQLRRTANPRLP